jgi:hypothetical protein
MRSGSDNAGVSGDGFRAAVVMRASTKSVRK